MHLEVTLWLWGLAKASQFVINSGTGPVPSQTGWRILVGFVVELRLVLEEGTGTMLPRVLEHIPRDEAAEAVRFGGLHVPELHLSYVLDLLVNGLHRPWV